MGRKKKQSQVSKLMARIGLVEPKRWPLHCRWWFRDKEAGRLPCDPYSRQYYLSIGYRPDHSDLYEGGHSFDSEQWNVLFDDGVSPIFRGEQEPPRPRALDLQADAEPPKDRLSTLIERIRGVIFEEDQGEIVGTVGEVSERFGYIEPSQFGRDIKLVEDKLAEFGIDIERTRTQKQRHIRIYENKESPYHPIRQAHMI